LTYLLSVNGFSLAVTRRALQDNSQRGPDAIRILVKEAGLRGPEDFHENKVFLINYRRPSIHLLTGHLPQLS
jgi:hypothetical protein